MDVDRVLRALDEAGESPWGGRDEYWQARVFERLLLDDPSAALRRADGHPVAFVRAVGRTGDASWLPRVHTCFAQASHDPGWLGITASVAGRLGDRALLAKVEAAAQKLQADLREREPWYVGVG